MNILLTGGSGDLGTLLTGPLLARGDGVVNIDLAPPRIAGARHVAGSILERDQLAAAMAGVDACVHIAAWHGVHEKTRSAAEFHDLNVTGTFNALQAAADAGVKRFVFISSTSARDRFGIYGHTKILAEEMVKAYAARHPDNVYITLRPRAFIPPWNRTVYPDFIAFARWFMRGAVHINDFRDAVLLSLAHMPNRAAQVYIIDGRHDYSAHDLRHWHDGVFAKHYPEFVELAARHGLDTAARPKVLQVAGQNRLPCYVPQYSLKNMRQELQDYGTAGPPAPF
jgi:nucleoside-diphosphate-sugar epimerase